MTQQQPDPRKLAGDALELANAATKGPWDDNGQLEIIAGRGFPLFYHFEAEFYEPEENMTDDKVTANLAFVAYARGLVPDLATALLAALDRIDQLEKVVLAQMANESQLLGLFEDFDNGEELDTQPVSLRELEADILKAVENIGTQE